jgi:hypothetical protein
MIEDAEEALRLPPGEDAGRVGATGKPGRAGRKGRAAARVPVGVGAPAPVEADDEAAGEAGPSDPWAGLLQVGMALWQQFTAGAQGGSGGGPVVPAVGGALQALVKRDEKTGEAYLKLPVPSTEVIDKALRAVGALLEGLRK